MMMMIMMMMVMIMMKMIMMMIYREEIRRWAKKNNWRVRDGAEFSEDKIVLNMRQRAIWETT